MINSQYLIELTRSTLEQLESGQTALSLLLMKARRIAQNRGDLLNQYWIDLELSSLGKGRVSSFDYTEYRNRVSDEDWNRDYLQLVKRYFSERAFVELIDDQLVRQNDKSHGLSIAEIEDWVRMVEKDEEIANDRDVQLAKQNYLNILSEVRERLHKFLSKTERELLSGKQQTDIFLRNRAYLEEYLTVNAPTVLEQLKSAEVRVEEGDSEARSHALASCRRAFKSLADHFYPATDECVKGADGVEREMTDDKYRNRLLQYIYEKLGKSKQGEALLADVRSHDERIKSLYDLSCKGVHDHIAQDEAEQCVVQTTMLIASIVRIASQIDIGSC